MLQIANLKIICTDQILPKSFQNYKVCLFDHHLPKQVFSLSLTVLGYLISFAFYFFIRKKYEDLSQREKPTKSAKAHKREVEAEYNR